jgi:hypothetical protein
MNQFHSLISNKNRTFYMNLQLNYRKDYYWVDTNSKIINITHYIKK